MKKLSAMVVTVGSEILRGKTLNRHLLTLGKFLLERGIEVSIEMAVPDRAKEIAFAIRVGLEKEVEYIVTVGGLGPTQDDCTLEGVAMGMDRLLVEDERAYQYVIEGYNRVGLSPSSYPRQTKKMAMIPSSAVPIPNRVGVAPAVVLVEDWVKVVSLPGMPEEFHDFLTHPEILSFFPPPLPFREPIRFLLPTTDEREAGKWAQEIRKIQGVGYVKTIPQGFDQPVILYVEFLPGEEGTDLLLQKAQKMGMTLLEGEK
jgi:molybdopterin-biosynthesis enzyme MoeA-like protein